MTASIIKVGYLYRWLICVNGHYNGGVCHTWEQALAETVKAGEVMMAAQKKTAKRRLKLDKSSIADCT
jgi:hypothetical protein